MKYFSLYLLLPALLTAEVKTLPSFQGFQGVVNTPNAEVMREGDIGIGFTNQTDNVQPLESPDYRDNNDAESYFLTMGVLPNLDATFRYVNDDYISDRSISLKYQIPYFSQYDYLNVAIGMQDIGGASNNFGSTYVVGSLDVTKYLRASAGYAFGEEDKSLDSFFGSMEYQLYPWMQVAVEYDTKEWNAVIKADQNFMIGKQEVNVGLMAKSSFDYSHVYLGVYANFPFSNDALPRHGDIETIRGSHTSLEAMGFSNIQSKKREDTLRFEYENTLYAWNDIEALGIVLKELVLRENVANIIVTVKKANLPQYTVKVNREAYLNYLKSGVRTPGLFTFENSRINDSGAIGFSDTFRPLFSLQPDFLLIDGSEYGHMDYTAALKLGTSVRIASGTILSGQSYLPVSMSEKFDEGGVFAYRNRHKTDPVIDQLLISQYFYLNTDKPWINLIQAGLFDHKLYGVSWESGMSDESGKHQFMAKYSYLKDDLYDQLDRYNDADVRQQKLLSYKYYMGEMNANIKVTGGEFLYGDMGVSLSLERYFSDFTVRFDIASTKHDIRGTNNIGKLSLSIPIGPKKRYRTKHFDIEGGDVNYERRKTLTTEGGSNLAHPLHLKEIDNDFTLENYFLDKGRAHPSYIYANTERLRNIALD